MAYELKTKANDASVKEFLDSIEDEQKKLDCIAIAQMMQEATDQPAMMWGKSIVGFGTYTYKYASGHSGDWMRIAFSPRKQNITIYMMPGFTNCSDLMDKLGKFKTGKCCLYIKRLSDIDTNVLRELIELSLVEMAKIYGPQK